MNHSSRNVVIAGGIIVMALIVLVWVRFIDQPVRTQQNDTSFGIASGTLPTFTPLLLLHYDGTDPALPIYIGLDGYVYDVTEGKAFYATGGTYHTLAGKDASTELHFFGGDIIKEKYPIIGIIGQ